jgi:hypothetical protein
LILIVGQKFIKERPHSKTQKDFENYSPQCHKKYW